MSKDSSYSLSQVIDELRKEELEATLYEEAPDENREEWVEKKRDELSFEDEEFAKFEERRYKRKKNTQFKDMMEDLQFDIDSCKDDNGNYSFNEEQKNLIKELLKTTDLDVSLKKEEDLKEEYKWLSKEKAEVFKKIGEEGLTQELEKEKNELDQKMNKVEKKLQDIAQEYRRKEINSTNAKLDQELGGKEGLLEQMEHLYFLNEDILFSRKEKLKSQLESKLDKVYKEINQLSPKEANKVLSDFESSIDKAYKRAFLESSLKPSLDTDWENKSREELEEILRQLIEVGN